MERLEIWKDTQERYKYMPIVDSVKFTEPIEIPFTPVGSGKMLVMMANPIDMAVECKKNGASVAIHNPCNPKRPGGSIDLGAMGLEEQLFTRSCYFRHLTKDYYPLQGTDTVLSRNVEFHRYGYTQFCMPMEKHIKMDIIAAPAPMYPVRTPDGRDFMYEEDRELMRKKIDMVFNVAVANGNECLILPAWGCKENGCPQEAVALLYKEALEKWLPYFNAVFFVVEDHTLDIFAMVINGTIEPFVEDLDNIKPPEKVSASLD